MIHEALTWLAQFAVQVIEWGGYGGLALLMAAESMVLPVPSEAVMPFAGYVVSQGGMSWGGAILFAALGSVVGSWLSYLMGRHGVLPLVERWGKYALVHPHHLHWAERLFARRGMVAVFLCRFIPGVRHASSILAGAGRMRPGPFIFATFAGATLWNTFLLWVGWKFGENKEAIAALKSHMDLVGAGLLALIAAYIVWEIRSGRAESTEAH